MTPFIISFITPQVVPIARFGSWTSATLKTFAHGDGDLLDLESHSRHACMDEELSSTCLVNCYCSRRSPPPG